MWIKIEPNDVLMFRGSRPFSAGQNFVARSSFPPNPQVMTGAIRTTVIRESGTSFEAFAQHTVADELQKKIGLPPTKDGHSGSLGNLNISGPFICKINDKDKTVERLFPIPQDVLYDKVKKHYVSLRPSRKFGKEMQTTAVFDTWQPLLIPDYEKDRFEAREGWFTEKGLKAYLDADDISIKDVVLNRQVSMSESHIGIGLDYSRRAVDENNNLFYRVEFDRLYATSTMLEKAKEDERPYTEDSPHQHVLIEDFRIGLMVQVNDRLLSPAGYITLGGERRFATYSDAPKYKDQFSNTSKKGNLKIVLQTPAYFHDGWRPEAKEQEPVDWSQWLGKNAKLVSIAATSPTIISGWDIVLKRPKPLYRYMPVGSVYYFEDADWQGKPFTEFPTTLDAGAMGFGTITVGTWNYLD